MPVRPIHHGRNAKQAIDSFGIFQFNLSRLSNECRRLAGAYCVVADLIQAHCCCLIWVRCPAYYLGFPGRKGTTSLLVRPSRAGRQRS